MKFTLSKDSVGPYQNFVEADKALREGRSFLASLPPFIRIEITSKCNLKCEHCWNAHYRLVGQDITPAVMERLEKEVFPSAAAVQFTDLGEPFLYRQIKEVLDSIGRYRFPYSKLFTNAQVMTPDLAERIVDSGLKELAVSIDGATEKTYEFIRSGANFNRLIQTLDLLYRIKKERGSPTPVFTFNVVAMEQNLDELEAIVRLASKYEVKQVFFFNLHAITEEIARRAPAQHPERTRQALINAFNAGKELGIEVRTDIDIGDKNLSLQLFEAMKNIEEKIINKSQDSTAFQIEATPDNPGRCEYPWKYISVKVDGTVHPCRFLSQPTGNLNEESFGEIWNSPFYQRLRTSIADGSYSLCKGAGCPFMTCRRGDLQAAIRVKNPHITAEPGKTILVPVSLTNTGNTEWNPAPDHDNPFYYNISYHLMDQADHVLLFDGLRTKLPGFIKPGETVEIDLQVQAPEEPGIYHVNMDIVRERVTWFGSVGSPTTTISLDVQYPDTDKKKI